MSITSGIFAFGKCDFFEDEIFAINFLTSSLDYLPQTMQFAIGKSPSTT